MHGLCIARPWQGRPAWQQAVFVPVCCLQTSVVCTGGHASPPAAVHALRCDRVRRSSTRAAAARHAWRKRLDSCGPWFQASLDAGQICWVGPSRRSTRQKQSACALDHPAAKSGVHTCASGCALLADCAVGDPADLHGGCDAALLRRQRSPRAQKLTAQRQQQLAAQAERRALVKVRAHAQPAPRSVARPDG